MRWSRGGGDSNETDSGYTSLKHVPMRSGAHKSHDPIQIAPVIQHDLCHPHLSRWWCFADVDRVGAACVEERRPRQGRKNSTGVGPAPEFQSPNFISAPGSPSSGVCAAAGLRAEAGNSDGFPDRQGPCTDVSGSFYRLKGEREPGRCAGFVGCVDARFLSHRFVPPPARRRAGGPAEALPLKRAGGPGRTVCHDEI